ncbi:MAG: LysM peptidoglycan-binding domain-containing protein [Defluviitaleaceae bacterium]|nr:LysM peptidoglycan-binding domain-containing protein [Defluviitaleaceae bacterium]MCL2240398.1 LysM peptidoglycan-binding domain-containing protein [Defluviitaleaceae bacterium]
MYKKMTFLLAVLIIALIPVTLRASGETIPAPVVTPTHNPSNFLVESTRVIDDIAFFADGERLMGLRNHRTRYFTQAEEVYGVPLTPYRNIANFFHDTLPAGAYVIQFATIHDGQMSALSTPVRFTSFYAGAVATPTGLTLEGSVLSWNPVAHAVSYHVRLFCGLSEWPVFTLNSHNIQGTYVDLQYLAPSWWDWDWAWEEQRLYSIQVTANGNWFGVFREADAAVFSDSARSTPIFFFYPFDLNTSAAPPAPTLTLYDTSVLLVESDSPFTSVSVYVDGARHTSGFTSLHRRIQEQLGYTFAMETDLVEVWFGWFPAGTYEIQVSVMYNGRPSQPSAPVTFTSFFRGTLAEPEGLRMDDSVLQWDGVEGADVYGVFITRGDLRLYSEILRGDLFTSDFLWLAIGGLEDTQVDLRTHEILDSWTGEPWAWVPGDYSLTVLVAAIYPYTGMSESHVFHFSYPFAALPARGGIAPLPPIPVAGYPLIYTVQYGETLWSIAFNFYGSMRDAYVNRISAANRGVIPAGGALTPGMEITLPAQGLRSPVVQTHLAGAVGAYLVRRGDTLKSIAYTIYGDAARWTCLREANAARIGPDNRILEGQWLVVP